MAGRSDRMYKNSPKIVADESGKKKIQKGPTAAEKESARVSDGTAGIPIHERHMSEVGDMYKRHQTEYGDMVKRHVKETKSSAAPQDKGD